MKSEKQNLETLYAPLIDKLTKWKERATVAIQPWGYKKFFIAIALYLLLIWITYEVTYNGGATLALGSIGLFLFVGIGFWNMHTIKKLWKINNAAKYYVLTALTELLSKESSWDLQYQRFLKELPENVSEAEFTYIIESVTGFIVADLVIDDCIIGNDGDHTFNYFNFGYYHSDQDNFVYSGEKFMSNFLTSNIYDDYVYGGEGLILNLNKSIDGYLYVISDTLEKHGGFLGKGIRKSMQSAHPFGNEIITMDSPEFEKYFAVHGEDKVLANYILTPTFMENLVNLAKMHEVTTYIVFYKNWMFMAMDTKHNKFELKLEKEEIVDEIQRFRKELTDILEIVETINLNMHEINIHAK